MFTLEEVKEIIQKGENSSVEFKSADVRKESLAKEMVAFSNGQGGLILLGVEDDGTISGLLGSQNYEEWVMNLARNNVIPSVQVEFQNYSIEGKRIGFIDVPRGKDKPYQTLQTKYLIRVGTTNRIATQQELLRLFQATGAFHFDATVVEGSSIQTLNLSKIDNYFRRYSVEFAQEDEADKVSLLVNSDVLDEHGNVTVGGMLIFGVNPSRYLPQSGISFAHFTDNDIGDTLLDKQNIEGTLDYQIDTTLAVIKNNWLMPSQIKGTKREHTMPIFSDKVFRELLTNACVHRNYAIHGSQIRVFMFANRLEFRSPGRLPNTITIEKLKVGVSYAVNPILVKFMENLRYIERLGRGLPMVYREVTQSNKRVEFKEVGEEFWVTLWL
ncbi:putative DNA binding domain-containing protein [Anaerolineales bacterium HSG24]|nr:putative DNA binding domain-containing protein [Anaerolineales bacterium HSG24]